MSIASVTWDEETDVLVVGGGPAGFAAAHAAAAAGARTVLVEKRGELGGNATYASGYAAFAGTAYQKGKGREDSAAQFLDDMRTESGRWKYTYPTYYDESVARVYAERSGEVGDRLVALGLRFRDLIPRRHKHTTDRMHAIDDVRDLRQLFSRVLGSQGVDIRLRGTVERLAMSDGQVLGVRLRTPKGSISVRAVRGVVLAAGGFQGDPLQRQLYQPEPWCGLPHLGIAEDEGDGHRMAAAAGARMINMSLLPPFPIVATTLVEQAIAVNKLGQRFHDESDPFGTAAENQEQPSEISFYIFDAEAARRYPHYVATFPRPPETAPTLELLAEKVGIDPRGLVRTVAEWNAAVRAESPQDRQFGRLAFDRRGITVAPFHAARIRLGISVTYGGAQVDDRMRALDAFGNPIPGLFAAGNCAGNLAPVVELGGIHIGGAFVLGMVAGEAAARRKVE